jgi:Predicted membrane protein
VTPVNIVIIVASLAAVFCWIASVLTKDTSWVDRLWSIVPVAYVWIFAGATIGAGADPGRIVLMAVLVTAWGARLTFNFARKGGYSGVEDYRWAILRSRMKPWQFQAFNLLFIVGYQMTLLVLITLPAAIAWQHPSPLGLWDGIIAALFVAFLIGETIADQQQWDFHQAKKRGEASGFLATGLFATSRHPNFFFEQAQWWAFYALGASAAVSAGRGLWGGGINPTIIGPVLLTVLFIGSTIFTESISTAKYPAYADYRRRTSMWIPLPRRRSSTSA